MIAEVFGLLQDRSDNFEKRIALVGAADRADLTGGMSRATHSSSSNSEAASHCSEEDEEDDDAGAGECEETFQQNTTACADKEINLFNNYANSTCTNIAAHNIGPHKFTFTHVAAACLAAFFSVFSICSNDLFCKKRI